MRRTVTALAVAAPLMLASGCSAVPGFLGGCGTADDKLVKAIMSTAKRDFEAGGAGGSKISHLEFKRGRTSDLPDDLRKFGMTELVGLDVVAWSADAPAGSEFGGVHIPPRFAVSADHKRFVPVDHFARDSFDVDDAALEDPGYEKWADAIDDSDADNSVYKCIS